MGKDAEISTVEIAQKQRHLHLLQKVKGDKSLNAKELKELTQYEAEAAKQAKKKTPKDKRRRARNKQGRFAAQTDEPQLAALAAELKRLAAMDEQFESHFEGILEKYPRVKTAWEQAISQRVEDAIRLRFATASQKDYRRITLQQLVEITGRTRITIYNWVNKGLARNADGSFYLPTFLAWFEKYTVSKLPPSVIAEINPLTKLKERRLQKDLDLADHQLLKRDEVMAGQIARHQNLINAFSHKAEEVAMLAVGQPQEKIAELLNNLFDEVLRAQCQVPEQLQLPEEKAGQFRELLESLKIKD